MPIIAGKEVGHGNDAIGFGLMGFTWRPNPLPHAEAIKTMKTALDSGANLWNGGQLYGTPENNSLHLLNAYFTQYPEDKDRVAICIKGGLNTTTRTLDGSRAGVHQQLDECLEVLDGKKFLDMWEMARVDANTPIEETIEAAVEYIKAGKLGGICLSECGPDTIRRAAAIHKIEGVEVELSLFCDDIMHNGIAKACAETGTPIIAYSPLGRGFLTGQIKTLDDLPADDGRRHFPRFSPENFSKNIELVKEVEAIAKRKNCAVGQVALAWVRAKSGKNGNPIIIPIPGATTEDRVLENNHLVELTSAEENELDEFVKKIEIAGDRYPAMYQSMINGETRARA